MAEKPASDASSNYLLFEDVFQRWHARLGSSEGKDELRALLLDCDTCSAKHRVDASGKEIPGTFRFVDREFWKDPDTLSVFPDANGVDDHLAVLAEYVHPAFDESREEFLVRRIDVERWERRYSALAPSSPPSKEPAPSEELSNKPRQWRKPGPKPDFDWEKIEAKCYDLMDYHDDFTQDDPDWDCQARLEEALLDFCQQTWGREPGASTLRRKLPGWLSIWHERKTSGV
jgi:hypothetical protein